MKQEDKIIIVSALTTLLLISLRGTINVSLCDYLMFHTIAIFTLGLIYKLSMRIYYNIFLCTSFLVLEKIEKVLRGFYKQKGISIYEENRSMLLNYMTKKYLNIKQTERVKKEIEKDYERDISPNKELFRIDEYKFARRTLFNYYFCDKLQIDIDFIRDFVFSTYPANNTTKEEVEKLRKKAFLISFAGLITPKRYFKKQLQIY